MTSSVGSYTKQIDRKSGILLHPTSFPSPYGIGDLGKFAYDFIDFLEKSKQKLWQILPLGPTGYGDSPYQTFSSFAGQPLIISPEKLFELNLLSKEDIKDTPIWDTYSIDYGSVIPFKTSILKKAYTNFSKSENSILYNEYLSFCKNEADWLLDYALYMSAKDAHNGKAWPYWEESIAFFTTDTKKEWIKKLENDIDYYQFIQFIFNNQWLKLKEYANNKGIEIIGDIPIFTAFDSADVWANKELFYLDSKGYPTAVAGVPPDYFSKTGQLWGNPLYDWAQHKVNNYSWWIKRIAYTLKLVDILRIDHFRGFEAYWAIPYGSENAINGEWKKGPYKDLFYALESFLGKNLPIIAEDLGVITPAVEELRDYFNFPGMKILQFAFEDIDDNAFLPHNHNINSVCYSGTHDNDTTVGWYNTASNLSQDKVRRYMNTNGHEIAWDFIRTCFGSVSKMAIVPIQDILSQGSFARMNTPGTTDNNWKYRYTSDMLTDELAKKLKEITILYGR